MFKVISTMQLYSILKAIDCTKNFLSM